MSTFHPFEAVSRGENLNVFIIIIQRFNPFTTEARFYVLNAWVNTTPCVVIILY